MSKSPPFPDILRQIASLHGTPTFVYFEEKILENCARLERACADLPVRLLYAMKANFNPAILRIIQDQGWGVDAVSPGELELALRVGFTPDRILYSANNITKTELLETAERGVLINFGELNRLEDYGRAFPGSKISLRVNPDIGSGHHEYVVTAGANTKFGITVDSLKDALKIISKHQLKVVALHEHIGSGFLNIEDWWAAMNVLMNVAERIPHLSYLNFGGGLGIPYRENEEEISLERFTNEYVTKLLKWRERFQPSVTFMFEPGRFLVAESGVLLTTVTSVKKNKTKNIVGTDTGQNHLLRPVLYGAYHEIVNISSKSNRELVYDVTGNICETGDRLAQDRPIKMVEEGNILACLDVGAYCMSMASWYNLRGFPTEVLVRTDQSVQVIRKSMNPSEFVDYATQGCQW